MQVDYQTKVLRAFSREYNRWESVEEFKVVRRNRLKKVSQKTEDYTDANRVKITTKRLVKGRWQTKVKYVKRNFGVN
jgi:long-subunit fatty acid transport protein